MATFGALFIGTAIAAMLMGLTYLLRMDNAKRSSLVVMVFVAYFVVVDLHLAWIFFIDRENIDATGLVEILRMSFPAPTIQPGEADDCIRSYYEDLPRHCANR